MTADDARKLSNDKAAIESREDAEKVNAARGVLEAYRLAIKTAAERGDRKITTASLTGPCAVSTDEAHVAATNQLIADGFTVVRVKVRDRYSYEVSW